MTKPSNSNSNKHFRKRDKLKNAIWFNSNPTDQGRYIDNDTEFTIDETTRKRRAKRSAHWQNHIDWDLKHEVEMHRLLVHWAQSGVSMKQIGESLVNMLYRRDDHLGCRLTKMINRCETYVAICIDMLQYYDVRDERGCPLWE